MTLLDAHNHLHDARLAPHLAQILPELARLNVRQAVVNGTREDDWAAVAELSRQQPWLLPSFGLHPWYISNRTPKWRENLERQLDAHPNAGVGEIGLDRWIEGHNLPDQIEVFTVQLAIAAERNLPVTIHCIRAWGALSDVLSAHPLPRRGFLIHAYGGPSEMVQGFVERGAYFSFSPSFLHERKAAQRATFAAIPAERVLVETDAPDLRPPDACNPHPLRDEVGDPINHPANLEVAYRGLAEIRNVPVESLADLVAKNFARLFGAQS